MLKDNLMPEPSKDGLLRGLAALPLGDPQTAHFEADELLLWYINNPEITAVWREIADRHFNY